MNEDSGFTLIELMIVVAIIGILVAVGMPQYQNYVARSQVAEGFSLASGLKTALAEYYSTNGTFPNNGTSEANTVIGVEAAKNIKGKYVEKVTVSDDGVGAITVLFGSLSYHDERFLRLTAIATDGAVSFPCTTDIEEPYRPKDCKEGSEWELIISSHSERDIRSPDISVPVPDPIDPGIVAPDITTPIPDPIPDPTPDPIPWTLGSGDACWDSEYAAGAGGGNGWVVGSVANTSTGNQYNVNTLYAKLGYGVPGTYSGNPIDAAWVCQ